MSNTANIRNLLTPMNALSDIVLHDPSYEEIPKLANQVKECVEKICEELKHIDDLQFDVHQIKTYLRKQDSWGDALYNLRPENIKRAQTNWCQDCKLIDRCEKLDDQAEGAFGNYACPAYEGK